MGNARQPRPTGLDDPNAIDPWGIVAKLAGEVPVVGKLTGLAADLIIGQNTENERYNRLLPVTLKMIELTGVDSIESKILLNELASTRPFGGRRQNFIDYYIKNSSNWKKLPQKASEIMYGY